MTTVGFSTKDDDLVALRERKQYNGQEIIVDYDASRLRTEDVGAALKRGGIPVELEK